MCHISSNPPLTDLIEKGPPDTPCPDLELNATCLGTAEPPSTVAHPGPLENDSSPEKNITATPHFLSGFQKLPVELIHLILGYLYEDCQGEKRRVIKWSSHQKILEKNPRCRKINAKRKKPAEWRCPSHNRLTVRSPTAIMMTRHELYVQASSVSCRGVVVIMNGFGELREYLIQLRDWYCSVHRLPIAEVATDADVSTSPLTRSIRCQSTCAGQAINKKTFIDTWINCTLTLLLLRPF